MRTFLLVILLVTVGSAGCTKDPSPSDDVPMGVSPDPVDDVCSLGVCAPTEQDMEEADLQPSAVPLLGFHQDHVATVRSMARLDDGWAFAMRSTDDDWSVLMVDELDFSGKQYLLPAGHTMDTDGLLVEDGRLFATSWAGGSRSGVTLHTWDLETDRITKADLDMPTSARVKGAYGADVLVVAERGLLSGDSSAWVWTGVDLIPITTDGRVMDADMATGVLYLVVESDGDWTVRMQDVAGDFQYEVWSDTYTISGVWATDDRIAFATILDTGDPAGGRLWEVDHFDHTLARLGQGWDVRFSGAQEVAYLTAKEGTSPFIAQWSRSLQAHTEGSFLPDGSVWDMTTEGLWWLEMPRIDYRFIEVPNPTPFTVMLFTTDR